MAESLLLLVLILTILTAILFLLTLSKNSILINAFGYYIVICAIFEIIANLTSNASNISNNFPFLHLFTLFEFLTLGYFFICIFKLSKIGWTLVLIGSGLIIANSIFLQNIYTHNSYARGFVYILIIFLCLLSLFKMISDTEFVRNKTVIQLLIFGLLLNFSGSFVLYLFGNIIGDFSIEIQRTLWLINVGLNIFSMILYISALVLNHKDRIKGKWANNK